MQIRANLNFSRSCISLFAHERPIRTVPEVKGTSERAGNGMNEKADGGYVGEVNQGRTDDRVSDDATVAAEVGVRHEVGVLVPGVVVVVAVAGDANEKKKKRGKNKTEERQGTAQIAKEAGEKGDTDGGRRRGGVDRAALISASPFREGRWYVHKICMYAKKGGWGRKEGRQRKHFPGRQLNNR